ncbi:Gfo/Idh/MocA family protein [Frankia sp. AgKG'84/4]|uniref:Gfo/Idh/MocA family protein n=1 Tax=Frankia sp. AgKG'84/4 TaxID=573490 RepID=UPI00200E187A|nr:Gfo/Idh/MocA family oxidoreductase [Frankia sp. AgKG'84/4]MCL9794454.1 Gfo/Idh/MocA family oxidoreductase [Frankia sp. AgKG'84/4]
MTLRVAVVGLGWAGRELWLPRLLGHPAYEVRAVVDPEPTGRAAAVALAGPAAPAALAGVHELAADDVDLAIVAVPNHLHAEISADLLRRGVAVFLEKPVCLSSTEVESLAAAERVGAVTLSAGSAARHRADVRTLARLVSSLGHLRHADLSWVRARGIPQAGGWFTQRDKAGGGALVDLGWHLLDTLTALVGPAHVSHVLGAVSADFVHDETWRAAWRHDDAGVAGDVEDTARGFLVRDDGVSVALRASWASHEALDTSRLLLEGSAGTATLTCTFGFSPNRLPHSELTLTRNGTTTLVSVPAEPVGAEYDRQLDELATRPWKRGQAIAEARATVRTIETFYQSASRPAPDRAPADQRAGISTSKTDRVKESCP